jgi:hypothetical protein
MKEITLTAPGFPVVVSTATKTRKDSARHCVMPQRIIALKHIGIGERFDDLFLNQSFMKLFSAVSGEEES